MFLISRLPVPPDETTPSPPRHWKIRPPCSGRRSRIRCPPLPHWKRATGIFWWCARGSAGNRDSPMSRRPSCSPKNSPVKEVVSMCGWNPGGWSGICWTIRWMVISATIVVSPYERVLVEVGRAERGEINQKDIGTTERTTPTTVWRRCGSGSTRLTELDHQRPPSPRPP